MAVIKALHHIWHDGERFTPGQVITNLDDETTKRLVESDAAFFVGHMDLYNELPESKNIDVADEENPREVIEENFTLEELKASAAEFKMKFPSNIKKQNLLDQIIAEGKEQSFLDLLED